MRYEVFTHFFLKSAIEERGVFMVECLWRIVEWRIVE
jgi:hypothetical protein